MPPKGKKGGKKKKQTKIAIDDVDTTILTRSKLEEYCMNVSRELNEETQNSDFLRLERNKLVNMVALSKEQLKMLRGKNREIENEIRDAEDEHRIIMEQNRQKVIHLKNDLENKYLDKKIVTDKIISHERDSHEDVVSKIILDITDLKRQILRGETYFFTKKIESEKQQAENIYIIRDKYKNSHILFETKRDKVIKEKTAQLRNIFSSNYNSLLDLKEKYYRMLLDNNTKSTIHFKHYYNRIVHHNQEIIQFLKNGIQKAKDSLGKLDRQYLQLKEENLKLTEELCSLDREKCILEEKLSSSEQQKHELKETKDELRKNKRLLQDLKIEYDVLDMIDEKKEVIQRKEDIRELKMLFNSISRIKSIIIVIELFALHIYNKLSEINANLSEIKGICEKKGKQNPVVGLVSEYRDTSLDLINIEIQEIAENRNDLFRTYRQILKKFNIPFENTGFKPLRFEEILAKIDNPRMLVNKNFMLVNPMRNKQS